MNLLTVIPCPSVRVPALQAAAAADEHKAYLPTHLVTRQEEIIGYISLEQASFMMIWLDSKRVHARESVLVLNTIENTLRLVGRKHLVTTCSTQSPFRPVMPELGFTRWGAAEFYHKEL